jgi:hypothetical protein
MAVASKASSQFLVELEHHIRQRSNIAIELGLEVRDQPLVGP